MKHLHRLGVGILVVSIPFIAAIALEMVPKWVLAGILIGLGVFLVFLIYRIGAMILDEG